MHNLVPLLVAIPLGVAFFVPLAIRLDPRLADVLSNLTFSALLVLCLSLPGREFIYHMGAWPTPNGIDLRVDGLTTLMLLTINGLAITNEMRGLAEYFRLSVIAGPDAFVIAANDYDDYARAILEKLRREIAPRRIM